jgi:hypothetical protein
MSGVVLSAPGGQPWGERVTMTDLVDEPIGASATTMGLVHAEVHKDHNSRPLPHAIDRVSSEIDSSPNTKYPMFGGELVEGLKRQLAQRALVTLAQLDY